MSAYRRASLVALLPASRVEQPLRRPYLLGVARRRSPALVDVVDGAAVVVADGAIGERQQPPDDLQAGAGGRRDRPVQGRPAVRVRQVGRRAVAQQQIDDFGVAHVGRAVQRRRSHAAGARVHVRPAPQQNLAHADVPGPRCVMQRRVAGGVRRVGGDALPQQPVHAVHVALQRWKKRARVSSAEKQKRDTELDLLKKQTRSPDKIGNHPPRRTTVKNYSEQRCIKF